MLLCNNSEALVYLEYPSRHGRLHQGLDYFVYFVWILIVI